MTATAQEIEALPTTVQELVRQIEREEALTPARARALLEESDITLDDLKPLETFAHPAVDSYGRKVIYDGGSFELIAMSWSPGDFSAIHDHGYTQWGAVKVFGAAEHATFAYEEGKLRTRSRTVFKPGTVVPVNHDMIHQMGNSEQEPYLSLHLYGNEEREADVTADARIFDLHEGSIKYHTGGAFFVLPEEQVQSREAGVEADLPTWLRDNVELLRRQRAIAAATGEMAGAGAEERRSLAQRIYAPQLWPRIRREVAQHADAAGAVDPSSGWRILFRELQAAAELQQSLDDEAGGPGQLSEVRFWDQAIAPRHRDEYARYLDFLRQRFGVDFPRARVLSIGCRTGLIEEYLLRQLGVTAETLLAVEPSEALLRLAAQRIPARLGDPLALSGEAEPWSLTMGGIHALQRGGGQRLEATVEAVARLTRPGGLFVGDLLTASLAPSRAAAVRGPDSLWLEQSQLVPTASDVQRSDEVLELDLEGERVRMRASRERVAVPSPAEVVALFNRHFGREVHLYDAGTFEAVSPETAATAQSYLLVAQRAQG